MKRAFHRNNENGQALIVILLGIAIIIVLIILLIRLIVWGISGISTEINKMRIENQNVSSEESASLSIFKLVDTYDVVEQVLLPTTMVFDNCSTPTASDEEYVDTKTFMPKLVIFDNPLPLTVNQQQISSLLDPILESYYQMSFDENKSRTVSFGFSVDPNSKVEYQTQWKEIWDSGIAYISYDDQIYEVVYRVQIDLTYTVQKQTLECP